MRKPFVIGLLFVVLLVACDTKSPTGPSTVVIETPTPSTTTTSVPVPVTTTTTPTSTSTSVTTTIPLATTRTYVAFGQVPPTVPSQLTIVLQPLGSPLVWTVLGFYRTSGGGAGQVRGELVGTLDAGGFNGTLTSETPECVAQREFSGSLDPQFLRWSGGRTLADCKGSPLAFNSLLMLATDAPPPTSTVLATSTTTMPLQCGYSLSANGTSVPGAGGQSTVGLAAGPTCSWAVQNFVDWITVQPLSGSGSATIALTVAANPGGPRSATIVIAGLPFVVNQEVATAASSPSTATSRSTRIGRGLN